MVFMVNKSLVFSDENTDRQVGLDASAQKSSPSSTGKKGRGRPPKSAGSKPKISPVSSDTPKRARGRPAKPAEATSTSKKAVVVEATKQAASTNGDADKKKRGRPSKSSTSHGKSNGISKPQVICSMVCIGRTMFVCLFVLGSTNICFESSRTRNEKTWTTCENINTENSKFNIKKSCRDKETWSSSKRSSQWQKDCR